MATPDAGPVADAVKLTGLGAPNQLRPFIKDGTVEAMQRWSSYNEGWHAAHFAVGVKNGVIENEVGETFDVPSRSASTT